MKKRFSIVIAAAVVAAGFVGPAHAAPEPRTSWIVQVQRGASASALAAARGLGGDIGFEYSAALQGFSVTLPASAAAALAHARGVVAVEPDAEVTADDTQSPTPSWGIDRIDQLDRPLNGSYTYPASKGAGVRAYIIDTGIRSTHVEFGGRVVKSLGYTAISDKYGTEDCNGHGTHVSGTVGGATYGVAKAVTLVPVRVLNCRGSGTNSGVIAGIDFVAKAKAAAPATPFVANMSLGGGFSSALNTAVANAVKAGVVMVVAAGNSSADVKTSSPASEPSAITVAATDSGDTQASYSNFGSLVDLYAPGTGITSAWYTSNTASNTISGTSMATPHVTGAAALYLALHGTDSPAQVTAALVGQAAAGKVLNATAGTPNLLLYVGLIA